MLRLSTLCFCVLALSSSTALAQLDPGPGLDPTSLDHVLAERGLAVRPGTIELNARVYHLRLGGRFSGSATGTLAGFGFGLTEGLELGLDTHWLLDPEFDWMNGAILRGLFQFKNTRRTDAAFSLQVPITDGGVDGLLAGFPARFTFAERFSFFVGHQAIDLAFGADDHIALAANGGFGVSFTNTFGLRLDTQLLRIVISGGGDTTSIFDSFPLAASFLFNASRGFDVHGGISFPSLGDASDVMALNVGVLSRF